MGLGYKPGFSRVVTVCIDCVLGVGKVAKELFRAIENTYDVHTVCYLSMSC